MVTCRHARRAARDVALVGECSIPSCRKWRSSPGRHTESIAGRSLGGASPRRHAQSRPTSRAITESIEGSVIRGHGAPGEPDSRTQELAALVEHGLLDHMVRPPEQRLWNRQADCPRRLEIDDQLKPRRLLDREVAEMAALAPGEFAATMRLTLRCNNSSAQ
jgi:hypothetical protein